MLKFVNLSIRGIPEISRLIKENLVDAFKAGIKIRQKFQEVLDSFDDFLVEGEVAEAITKAMLSCAQKLGSFALLAEQNKRIPQTLGNWLNDYIQFGLSSGEHRTGSIARIQYFKVNQNAKQLSEEDRKLLLEVFRIYDWLRYGGDEEKSLELDEIFTEPTNYIKSEKFELPEEVVSPPPSGAQARPQPPSVPRRSFAGPVAPQVVNIQDILHKRDLSEEKVGGLKFGNGQAKSNLPPSKKQPEQTAMPNQEKSAQILPTSPPPVSLDKSRLVDKKLEELKKKLNKS